MKNTQIQGGTSTGVTLTPVDARVEDEVDEGKKHRKYVFVVYNFTEEQRFEILKKCERMSKWWIIGREICPTTGTPHLQGFVEWKSPMSWKNMRKAVAPGHIEVAHGTVQENRRYCCKDGDFDTNIEPEAPKRGEAILLQDYGEVQWLEWQGHIIDLVNTQYGDKRTINWFWEPDGNAGKSFLAKFLVVKYDAIIASGKTADIFNQTKAWCDSHTPSEHPRLVILDIPRCSLDYINYQAMEALKNGLLYSGKYEGGVCAFFSPVVIVFANAEPDTTQLSQDRWNIHRIARVE